MQQCYACTAGKLRGVLIALPGSRPDLGPVEAYFGLQYASILAGELRFMPPTSPMEKWDGIRVALKFRPACPQPRPDLERLEQRLPLTAVNHWKRLMPFLEQQQEECLNLNIYVPLRGTELQLLCGALFATTTDGTKHSSVHERKNMTVS